VNAEAAMASRAAVASLLVAVAVSAASLLQTPKYEASAQVRVDQGQGDQQTYETESGEEIQTLFPKGARLQAIILTLAHFIDSRPVAQEAIQRLGLRMEPAELLDNLTAEQVENTSFIRISYKGTDPVQAKQIVNTGGEVFSEIITERSRTLRATVYEEARVPDTPISPKPLRNGLFTLVAGLALSVGLMAWRGVFRR
jgi:capsular polysaccharide biosynthesis protein